MRHYQLKLWLFGAMLLVPNSVWAGEKDSTIILSDFKLRNIDGQMIATTDYQSAKGFIIIFTCNHCPFAKLYSKRLNALHQKYASLQVPIVAINSMDTLLYEDEGMEQMKEKARLDHFLFPYLQDASQAVGKAFKAEHTPAAYVIWKVDNRWVIKYKGAIDSDGEHPEKAEPYLAQAVDDLLESKQVRQPQTHSFGCRIIYRK